MELIIERFVKDNGVKHTLSHIVFLSIGNQVTEALPVNFMSDQTH